MKISPIPQGNGGNPSTDISNLSPSRIERAKAIAAGQVAVRDSETPQAPKPSVRRITMRTNVSPDRDLPQDPQSIVEPSSPVESATADTNAVPPVVEDTKPLDPQFAALAKQRRALQVKERELADREKALASQPTSVGAEDLVARLKSQPLSVLQEHGVTYDQLTEAILANQTGNPEIYKLKEEIKAIKDGVEKTLSEKDAQAEKQVLAEIRRETERLAQSGDAFEMVRETKSFPEVVELIHRTYKQTGEILDVTDAMQLVENDLIQESLKLANIGKVKSRLAPAPAPQQQQSQQKQFRTLTNRDSATPTLDRRSRAIAAALGNLKR